MRSFRHWCARARTLAAVVAQQDAALGAVRGRHLRGRPRDGVGDARGPVLVVKHRTELVRLQALRHLAVGGRARAWGGGARCAHTSWGELSFRLVLAQRAAARFFSHFSTRVGEMSAHEAHRVSCERVLVAVGRPSVVERGSFRREPSDRGLRISGFTRRRVLEVPSCPPTPTPLRAIWRGISLCTLRRVGILPRAPPCDQASDDDRPMRA